MFQLIFQYILEFFFRLVLMFTCFVVFKIGQHRICLRTYHKQPLYLHHITPFPWKRQWSKSLISHTYTVCSKIEGVPTLLGNITSILILLIHSSIIFFTVWISEGSSTVGSTHGAVTKRLTEESESNSLSLQVKVLQALMITGMNIEHSKVKSATQNKNL